MLHEKDALQAIKCAGLTMTRLYFVDPHGLDQNQDSPEAFANHIVYSEADVDDDGLEDVREQVFSLLDDEATRRGYQDWDHWFGTAMATRRAVYR